MRKGYQPLLMALFIFGTECDPAYFRFAGMILLAVAARLHRGIARD
jgi:hypothetical protein